MIGKLKGTLDEIDEDNCTVDVHGVGYVAHCSAKTLAALPSPGEAVVLYIETYVREDMIRLYGFQSPLEREWFRLLMGNVQGVGAKVALAILSALEIGDLQRALASGDSAMIARANGVGPKLAQRICHELKDKAGALGGIASGASPASGTASGPHADAVAALTGLGFKPGEASGAVAAASEELGAGASLDALVRLALRKAAK